MTTAKLQQRLRLGGQVHRVRFLDNPHSPNAREVGWTTAQTIAEAMAIAARRWGPLREMHGPDAGYVIEDPMGRRALVMPPRV